MKFVSVVAVALYGTLSNALQLNSGFVASGAPSLSDVQSADFGVVWQLNQTSSNEEFMVTPVVYNHGGSILFGSSLNKVYTLNALTGKVVASRQLRNNSFACGDLTKGVGILGSPVLSKDERTAWVYAKSLDGYYLHSFDAKTLKERPHFPVHVDGPATDGSGQVLNSTMTLQRPALSLIDGIVYGALGGGCDHSISMSGWIIGIDATTGKVVSRWPSGGGIWQTGRALSNDNSNRLFVAVANGDDNTEYEGSVVRLDLQTNGRLSSKKIDMFKPWNYTIMDESQRDVGAAPVALTDFVFKGKKTAIVGGKNGLVHVLDRENLGGYGVLSNSNKVLQEWAVPVRPDGLFRGRLFAGLASWPQKSGTAGWLYLRPVDLNSTFVYSFDQRQGFKSVAVTEDTDITPMGGGAPFVSVDSRGQGVLWFVDLNKGLLAWNATPTKAGKLVSIPVRKPIAEGAAPYTYKFQEPVFAGGKVYVLTREAGVVAYGKRGRL